MSQGRLVQLDRPTPTGDLPYGQIIPGSRYRVISKIGTGGMGSVYLAEHVDLQKKVALKVLAGALVDNPDKVESFRREARTASRIGNPFICDVTDFGEVPDGRVFFVMEYLEGHSLGRILRTEGRLPPARVIPILRQIAKALGATHEKGVVHLDVKPDNIMVMKRDRRDDFIKVVDFGISSIAEERRFNERIISGTPEYVAPERVLARPWDHRVDVYSLGVLAYEMLTGRHPLRGRDYVATLTMHVKDPPVPPSRAFPDLKLPLSIEKVVLKLLEKDPQARPESMAVVEGLLCEAQIACGLRTGWDDLELPAVEESWRTSLAERMPSPGARKRAIVAGAASGVAVVAAALAVYFGAIKKNVVWKEIRVAVTQTDEIPQVAALLVKAVEAVRRQRYVTPSGESALDFIELAEKEARERGLVSRGAQYLRTANGNALAAMGDELVRVGLSDLARVKYQEALAFVPNDPALAAKAESVANGVMAPRRRPAAPASREEKAQKIASDLWVAAREGRLSEARLELKALVDADPEGRQRARLADGLRSIADATFAKGKADEARSLYAVISSLDPADTGAARRAETTVLRAPEPEKTSAREPAPAAEPEPPTPVEREVASKKPRSARPAAAVEPEPDKVVRKDPAASQESWRAGQAALGRARLAEADQLFNKAVQQDPLNYEAVFGLAQVAYEQARYTEALDWARKAAAGRASPRFHVLIGDAYFKLLRYPESLAAYERAQKLVKGDSTEIRERLAKLRAKMK